MLKNLFELIALKGDGDGETLGTRTYIQVLTHKPPSETFTT